MRRPLRARAGRRVTQMHYARAGKRVEQRSFTVYFVDDKLARWEGDELRVFNTVHCGVIR